jgi:multiple sugar transport system permease protein
MSKGSLWVHLLLIVGALFMIGPFIWMLSTSVKTFGESMLVPPTLFPHSLQFGNYWKVFERLPFLHYYWNTIIITMAKTGGQLLFCSMAAYAFARIPFPGRGILFLAVLSILMVPSPVFIIPKYLLMAKLGWLNSLNALIVPGLFSAFGTFLLRQFFMTLPRELEEAARIDGCNHLYIYWRILLPLTKPAMTAFAIFSVLGSWNELLWPLIVIRSPELRPLAAGIASFQEQSDFASDHTLMMAGATMAVVPMLILFILLQRHFIEGIALAGIKQ